MDTYCIMCKFSIISTDDIYCRLNQKPEVDGRCKLYEMECEF